MTRSNSGTMTMFSWFSWNLVRLFSLLWLIIKRSHTLVTRFLAKGPKIQKKCDFFGRKCYWMKNVIFVRYVIFRGNCEFWENVNFGKMWIQGKCEFWENMDFEKKMNLKNWEVWKNGKFGKTKWKLLIFYFRDQLVIQLNMLNPDAHPRPATRVIRERNHRVLELVLDFENPQRTTLQYLRGIAHNFQLAPVNYN